MLAVVGWVLSVSCLYEIFEWLLAIVAGGETAERYNGQQGDPWDAQKDMALAALGALVVIALPRGRAAIWTVARFADRLNAMSSFVPYARKSVVSGKRVSVRVNLGCWRF